MSLLNDARRLAGFGDPFDDGGNYSFPPRCVFCFNDAEDGHAPTCPWLAVPRIVAALEAAAQAVAEWGHADSCPFCGPRLQRRPQARHDEVCPWMALMDVLKEGS